MNTDPLSVAHALLALTGTATLLRSQIEFKTLKTRWPLILALLALSLNPLFGEPFPKVDPSNTWIFAFIFIKVLSHILWIFISIIIIPSYWSKD